ncbi:MAG: chorismate synthase, partial [Spirochaetales bacterium]|nr:chorismate synthase [Spirochaetales bacterium]
MPGNSFGTLFKITTFGESHGASLGVIIDGVQANLDLDLAFIQEEMNRRRPGSNTLGTQRKERDE